MSMTEINLGDDKTASESVDTHEAVQSSNDNSNIPLWSQKWTNLLLTINRPIKKTIRTIARHAATHPRGYVVGIITVSIAIIIIGLVTNFNVDVDEDVLWTPRGSRPVKHSDWIDDKSGFPLAPRVSLLLVHTESNNVLGREGVRRVFEAVDTYRATPGYDELCALYDDKATCPVNGVTKFWNNSLEIFENQVSSDEDAILAMSAMTFPDGTPVDHKSIVGNHEKDENGVLTSGQIYLTYIDLPPEDDPAEDFEDKVLDEILDLQNLWNREDGNQFRLEVMAERSFADEFTRAILKDLPLLPMVFVVMSVFTCLVFAKRDWIYSRSLLGFGAVVTVLLAILSGYGLMFVIGVPFTSMTQILPFVMFGVGLDDAFIISGAYARTDAKKDVVERIDDTLEDVGVSIFITTATSVAAFGLGCLSSIPAVTWLCVYAFPTIAIDFLYQITFFVALIVIDEHRIAEKRRDCAVCCSVSRRMDETAEDEEASEKHLADRIMERYANILLKPWVKTTVLLGFAGIFGILAWSASQLSESFDFTEVLPSDSYLQTFWDALDGYSDRSGVAPSVYFRDVDQSDPSIQSQMEAYVSELVALDQISDPPTEFWLADFQIFVGGNEELQQLPFNEQVSAFLADPVFFEQYHEHIVRNENGDITASRTAVFMDQVDQEVVTEQVDALEAQRRVTTAQPVNDGRKDWAFFTFDQNYFIWEFYAVASEELLLTTILGVVAVSVIGFLFIPHWTAILFVAPMITMLYVDLMGFLQFAGLHINPVTYISLVMSIGLLVDFLMHVIMRYFESKESDRNAKTKDMLRTMGSSILIGGISTFLGVLPLAFSTSEILSTVFIAFIGLVVIGMTHGLIFLPVLLSLVGPKVHIFGKKEPEQKQIAEEKFVTQETQWTTDGEFDQEAQESMEA